VSTAAEEKLERERDTALRVAEEAMRIMSDEQLALLRDKLDADEDVLPCSLPSW
jgi:hypothetical protein